MNWQGEQVFSVLAQRLLSPPWVQRLRVTGTGIGWFVGLAIVSIPMAVLWLDYVQAMRNLTIPADYSVGSLPLILGPLIAWFLRSRPREAAAVGG